MKVRCIINVHYVRDLINKNGNIVPATDIIESMLLEEFETIEVSEEQYQYMQAFCSDGELHSLDEMRDDLNVFYKQLSTPRLAYIEKMYKDYIMDLATLRFAEDNKNILFLGNPGVGKTHLAVALGIKATQSKYSVYFTTCHQLISKLNKAQKENRIDKLLQHFAQYKVLIIDEIGYLPIGEQEAKMFFQLIDRRYEKKSTIVTSNINLSDWNQIFLDNMLASAILDRLVHHSTIVNILGNSYRTATALSKISDKNN